MVENNFKTDSGINVKQLFSKSDLKNGSLSDSQAGEYPFIRDNEAIQWIWKRRGNQ
jgi:hypothetical protein